MKKNKIYHLFLLIIFILAMVSLWGCGTLRGAATGFKEDWQVLRRFDEWFGEHWW